MDEKLHFVFDRLFFIDLRQKGYSLKVVPEKLAAFRIHDSSKTFSSQKYFYEENKKVNLEKAAEYGILFYFIVKRRHLFRELKKKFHSTQKITRPFISFLFGFIVQFPIVLIRRWFWAWFQIFRS